jgi:DNA repair exonuclease SbcCD ATPase subunit
MLAETRLERIEKQQSEIERLRDQLQIRAGHLLDATQTVKQLEQEIERLRSVLDGADRIANGWARQNVELRRLLRFFFENVPVSHHEGYADVMKRAKEMLGHDA